MEAVATSNDGLRVRMTTEYLRGKDVGKDFISNGLRDFIARSSHGLVLTLKGEAKTEAKRITRIVREEASQFVGRKPAIFPPTYSSRIIQCFWEGKVDDEQGLLRVVQELIQGSDIRSGFAFHKKTARFRDLAPQNGAPI